MTDKRILKQQYLQTKSRAGVYAIRNRVTGRLLVSGSQDVQGALNRHRFELRQGTHRNRLMGEDWSLHGEASFAFDVLDMVKPDADAARDATHDLTDLVALWRDETSSDAAGHYASCGSRS